MFLADRLRMWCEWLRRVDFRVRPYDGERRVMVVCLGVGAKKIPSRDRARHPGDSKDTRFFPPLRLAPKKKVLDYQQRSVL